MALEYGLWTEAGPERLFNEDFAIADGSAGVFVVADGAGGMRSGAFASALVATAVLERVVERRDGGPSVLAEAIAAAAATWRAVSGALGAADSGCTVAALWLVATAAGVEARVAHVGDCRVWRVRGGTVVRLTTDHSVVAELVARGTIAPEDAVDHPLAHVVTRFVGAEPVAAEVAVHAAAPGDVYVLCTDGAARVAPEDLATVCAARARRAASRLVEVALSRDGSDNVAVIVVQLPR